MGRYKLTNHHLTHTHTHRQSRLATGNLITGIIMIERICHNRVNKDLGEDEDKVKRIKMGSILFTEETKMIRRERKETEFHPFQVGKK